MITDEMLRTAAAKSSAVYVRFLERDFEQEHQHEFSSQFEKRIKRMCRRANHPLLYRSLQRIASIFLAILLGGVIWLTVDVEARAEFFGWVKSVYENYIVYRLETNSSSSVDSKQFQLTWLPDGYEEDNISVSGNTVIVSYLNDKCEGLIFIYSNDYKELFWFVDQSTTELKHSYVNQTPADLYIGKGPNTTNAIIWVSDDNTAFYISAFLGEKDLIKIAENVHRK